MALASGTHVGPYEILSAIGAGGMGEVYRAHDPKLGRDVAIKVLPEAFANDAQRMARFQREAKDRERVRREDSYNGYFASLILDFVHW